MKEVSIASSFNESTHSIVRSENAAEILSDGKNTAETWSSIVWEYLSNFIFKHNQLQHTLKCSI